MQTFENVIPGTSLLDYYQGINKSQIILLFKGAMSQNTLVRIGDLIRLPSEEVGSDTYSKRLFAIMVEMAQNILFYSQEREISPATETNVGVGIILVQQMPNLYQIICGNLINEDQRQRLQTQCLKINGMSQEELREYYSQQRRRILQEGSKGAGLGLIDIAKRSKNPLVFDFHPMNEGNYFFTLVVKINRDPQ
ncbi:MAG TPA: SiaB family protein kinase [Candidatus Methylacidiphilales bacterium]|nr:SiaB family protein kinase [Candidatus Methylacidiphilales bacterium]